MSSPENRLLKAIRGRSGFDPGGSLAVWDEQLVQYGARLIEKRFRWAGHEDGAPLLPFNAERAAGQRYIDGALQAAS